MGRCHRPLANPSLGHGSEHNRDGFGSRILDAPPLALGHILRPAGTWRCVLRRLHARIRRGRRAGQALALQERLGGGQQRVQHGAAALARTTGGHHRLQTGHKGLRACLRPRFGTRLAELRGHAHEHDAHQDAAGSAHGVGAEAAEARANAGGIRERHFVQSLHDLGTRTRQRGAAVCISHLAVEGVQNSFCVDEGFARLLQQGADLRITGGLEIVEHVLQLDARHGRGEERRHGLRPGRAGGVGAEEVGELGREAKEGQRHPVHVQGRAQRGGAQQQLDRSCPLGLHESGHHDAHLQLRHGSQVVDQACVAVGSLCLHAGAGQDLLHEFVHDHGGAGYVHGLRAGLAVDAEAELHLLLGDHLGLQPPHRGQGDTHARRGVDHCLGCGLDLGQRLARLGQRAAELVHEERAGDAALSDGGDVVLGEYCFHLEAVEGLGLLRRECEVQPVARVVLDNQQAALGTSDVDNGGKHRVDGRRGEGLPRDRRGEHALADEAAVHGLVASAAAADDGDLALVPVRAEDHLDFRVAVQAGDIRCGPDQAIHGVLDNRRLLVDEALRVRWASLWPFLRRGLSLRLDLRLSLRLGLWLGTSGLVRLGLDRCALLLPISLHLPLIVLALVIRGELIEGIDLAILGIPAQLRHLPAATHAIQRRSTELAGST
mmetsp:Transcript_169115/g.537326  ORF Transcript_169115/g.537326 Transcript_169115/m.537326 type:complete len:661 (+) Transcript_169115:316-2298(+)